MIWYYIKSYYDIQPEAWKCRQRGRQAVSQRAWQARISTVVLRTQKRYCPSKQLFDVKDQPHRPSTKALVVIQVCWLSRNILHCRNMVCKRSKETRRAHRRHSKKVFEASARGLSQGFSWPLFMCGLYYHFNNLRFNKSPMISPFPFQVLFFVSSDFLKCRLLKWLSAVHELSVNSAAPKVLPPTCGLTSLPGGPTVVLRRDNTDIQVQN